MRLYRLALIAAAAVQTAGSKDYRKPIAYVLDSGSKHRGQVLERLDRHFTDTGWPAERPK